MSRSPRLQPPPGAFGRPSTSPMRLTGSPGRSNFPRLPRTPPSQAVTLLSRRFLSHRSAQATWLRARHATSAIRADALRITRSPLLLCAQMYLVDELLSRFTLWSGRCADLWASATRALVHRARARGCPSARQRKGGHQPAAAKGGQPAQSRPRGAQQGRNAFTQNVYYVKRRMSLIEHSQARGPRLAHGFGGQIGLVLIFTIACRPYFA